MIHLQKTFEIMDLEVEVEDLRRMLASRCRRASLPLDLPTDNCQRPLRWHLLGALLDGNGSRQTPLSTA